MENRVIPNQYNNSMELTGKFEVRTIVDDAPITEWNTYLLPNIIQNNENILKVKKKIFPFVTEDLKERYNIDRFPKRIRRMPRVLIKYNTLANYAVVTVYLLFHADKQGRKKPRLTHYAILAHDVIDAPIKSLKAKISQLDRWNYIENNPQISYGLISAYNDISHINPHILWNIIKKHETLDAETEIKKLINKEK